MNKLAKMVSILTVNEDFFLKPAPKHIGKLINKIISKKFIFKYKCC